MAKRLKRSRGVLLLILFLAGCAQKKEEGIWFLDRINDRSTTPAQELTFNANDGQILVFQDGKAAELDLRLGTVRCKFRDYDADDEIIKIPARNSCEQDEFRIVEVTDTTLQLARTSDPSGLVVRIYSKKDDAFLDQILQQKGLSRNDL